MMQNVLSAIGGVGVYGVISICVFFVIFGSALVWALMLKKPFLEAMSALPLVDEETPAKGESTHE